MRKIILLFAVTAIVTSCVDKSSTGAAGTPSDADTTKPDYAYSTDRPVAWEWGSKENIKTAMLALKAFEQGNIDESMKHFADSVMLKFDGYEKLLSRDTAAAFLKSSRDLYKTITVKMNDYESVKSKDGTQEYVSLWYKQIWEDTEGKVDSSECMNDVRFKDGKISMLNEKTRHYPVK